MPPIDYRQYPPNWWTVVRPAVLKRAGRVCERPGCDHADGEKMLSVKLYDTGRRVWVRGKKQAEKVARQSGWEGPITEPIIKPINIVLTVAHLDHDEDNMDVSIDRLQAMCQLCHLKYDTQEKQRRQGLRSTQPHQ